jgi:hypothetical protein
MHIVVVTLAFSVFLVGGAGVRGGGLYLLSAQPLDDEITTSMARAGWTNGQQQRAVTIFESAGDETLPTGSIQSRLLQGLARNVNPRRVLVVMEEQLQNLLEARAILTGVPGATPIAEDTPSLERTAALLRGGYTAEEITAVVGASVPRPDDYRAATLLYVAVVEWGADPAAALTLVRAAIAAPIPGDDFPRIASLLGVTDPRRYGSEEAVEIIADSLREGRSVREITRQLSR